MKSALQEWILYDAVKLFLSGKSAAQVAEEINEKHKLDDEELRLTRERVYPAIGEALRHRLAILCPTREIKLQEELERLPNKGKIEVVNACGQNASTGVPAVAARSVLELIKEIGAERAGGPVHLAFGIGHSSREFAQRLGALLRHDLDAPPVYFHALASSYSWNPLETPLACFAYFTETVNDTLDLSERFIGIFSDPYYAAEEYKDAIKNRPLLKRVFARKDEIDIVVTSIGTLGTKTKCEHGYLHQYLRRFAGLGSTDIEQLNAQGWRGDVQLRPFDENGPIDIKTGPKPVTLFELDELIQLAQKPGKHVYLLCGPCGLCGESKADALVWLLVKSSLRFWNHLVIDWVTAKKVIKLARAIESAAQGQPAPARASRKRT
jgi:hypothetical protein